MKYTCIGKECVGLMPISFAQKIGSVRLIPENHKRGQNPNIGR